MQASWAAAWHAAAAIWRHDDRALTNGLTTSTAPCGTAWFTCFVGTGLFFTLATGAVQVRLFGAASRRWRRKAVMTTASRRFKAFATGLASRVGVGNIAGVAIAASLAARARCFWMWVTALIRHELGFCRIIAGAAFQGARPAKMAIFEAAPPITSPKASSSIAGRGVWN